MSAACPHCKSNSAEVRKPIRIGRFARKSDGASIQRFRCLQCRRSFSEATRDPRINQNKRQINERVGELLCSGISQRRLARILRINRKTVVRKLLFLSGQAALDLERLNREGPKVEIVEFDELETIEHTKCKPLSALVAVEFKSRRLLGGEVASMPAKGKLAKIALKKYGRRKNERAKARRLLFTRLKPIVKAGAIFKTDECPHYPRDVAAHFPDSRHLTFKSRRGCVAGQGELKKIAFDPIFSINHTMAMLRANINRLFRRTWCTTKRPDRLAAHLMLYVHYHNRVLLGL